MSDKLEFLEKIMDGKFDFEDLKTYLKQKEASKEPKEEPKEEIVPKPLEVQPEQKVKGNGKTLKIKVSSSDGDKVNIKIPLELAKIALKMNPRFIQKYAGENELDLEAIIAMIDQHLVGELVHVQSSDNDTVSIVVE